MTNDNGSVSGDSSENHGDISMEDLSWDDLELSPTSREAVARMGFAHPTEVQVKAIPRVQAGVDLMVQAKTGSGKTLAFGLPILERLDETKNEIQALVLSPTRELAVQVAEEITRAGELGNKTVVPIYGGASIRAQIDRIQAGAKLVVGTPGRILDLINRGVLKLDRAWMVVLDEADEMLDRGFLPDVTRILEQTSKKKQTMLFSATLPNAIRGLAMRHLNEPETMTIGKAGLSINYDIKHVYYRVQTLYKFACLVNVLHSIPRTKVLVFCNQKIEVENVAEYLNQEGFAVGFLSGDLSQSVRTRTLDMFKGGMIDILVATDVAARGIDIFGVSHVINYDLPENQELYLHRTGRTGRAGRTGVAISLVSPADLLAIGTLKKKLGMPFEERPVPTKKEVDVNVKKYFLERLKAMETEEYPDDLSVYADDILESMDAYPAVAGLLTLLRQHGWDFAQGYDPDQPEVKDRLFVRPMLLGKKDIKEKLERQQSASRGRGGRSQQRSQSDRKPRTRKPKESISSSARKSEPREPKPKSWIVFSLGTEQGIKHPKDAVAFVCQTAGIKRGAVGKIELGENATRCEIDVDLADRAVTAIENRKKEPQATARRV